MNTLTSYAHAPLLENMMSSTKPEPYTVSHCCQRRSKPWPQILCTENFVKFAHMILEILALTKIAIHCTSPTGKVTTMPWWASDVNSSTDQHFQQGVVTRRKQYPPHIIWMPTQPTTLPWLNSFETWCMHITIYQAGLNQKMGQTDKQMDRWTAASLYAPYHRVGGDIIIIYLYDYTAAPENIRDKQLMLKLWCNITLTFWWQLHLQVHSCNKCKKTVVL